MVIVLFGVSGAGKTTVGRLLAEELGWSFIDADDFHPPANVRKMSLGLALDDGDREGWLDSLVRVIKEHVDGERDVVLACSALKASYRKTLAVSDKVVFVYLKADHDVTVKRLANRSGHFMNPALLKSQFDTLEEPDEGSITVETLSEPNEIVQLIKRRTFR